MPHRTANEVQIEVVTPLGIPLVFRGGRWFLGEIDITPMIEWSDVDLFPQPDRVEWDEPMPGSRPRVTFHINAERLNIIAIPAEG